MNIEGIKQRLSNLDAGKVVKYDHAMNLATQYMVDYRNDVSYLLSIIEQAEKALTHISFITRYSDHIVQMSAHNSSEEALQAFRGK